MGEENFLRKSRRHKRKRDNETIGNPPRKKNRKLSINVNKSTEKTRPCKRSPMKKYHKRLAIKDQVCEPVTLSAKKNAPEISVFPTVVIQRVSPRLIQMEKTDYANKKNKHGSAVDNVAPCKSVFNEGKSKLSERKRLKEVTKRNTFPLEKRRRRNLRSNSSSEKQAASYSLRSFSHLKGIPVDDLLSLRTPQKCQMPRKTIKNFPDIITLNRIKHNESPFCLLKKVPHCVSENRPMIEHASDERTSKVIKGIGNNSKENLINFKDGLKKRPRKQSLKYKRWVFNKLKDCYEDYEDDIYESTRLDSYKHLYQLESESEGSYNIATPKLPGFTVSPAVLKKTPAFKDCFSPTELMRNRKLAEEYMYRRNRSKVNDSKKSPAQQEKIPEKKKLDFEEALSYITDKQKRIEKSLSGENISDDDSNLSDLSDA